MTYGSQRVLSQGGSNGYPQEATGFKTINPRSPRRPGTKARRFTSIQVGDRFGRLTAVAPTDVMRGKQKCWIFRCDCGWEGPKPSYQTVTSPGTCGRRCPFQLVEFGRNPNGCGWKTLQGYMAVQMGGKGVTEHRLVWERAHGPIPKGMEIHHKDGNRSNNALTNLQLVTPQEHARIHAGWRQVDGVWIKPCLRCGKVKILADFNRRSDSVQSRCRDCMKEISHLYWHHNKVVLNQKLRDRRRRNRAKHQAIS